MIRSMTGYGAAVLETDALRASVAVRTLNHRYLDIAVHVPRRLLPLEADIKRRVQAHVERGRCEVSLQAAPGPGEAVVVAAPQPLVSALVRALRQIQQEHRLAGEVSVSDVARFPGMVELVEQPGALDEGRRGEILALVERALEGLTAMRRAEGANLEAELRARLAAIEAAGDRVSAGVAAARAARRELLLARVHELVAELGLDEGRLYQEVSRLVERSDVEEELQRLRSHVSQARALLDAEGPSGKRLDFLAQEMAREANTMGSKLASAELVQEVVALKGDVERLREQVQNVE
jgi:uncharacterized protein (TIGR00255 family)